MSDRLMTAISGIEDAVGNIELLNKNQIPDGYVAIPQRMFADLMRGMWQPYALSLHYKKMLEGSKP